MSVSPPRSIDFARQQAKSLRLMTRGDTRETGKKRVVIAGLGDTGLLVALDLHPGLDVIAVTPKPGLVSGQELGTRLARPDAWRKHFLTAFPRYRRLDGMPIVHGLITAVSLDRRRLHVRVLDGAECEVPYDVLVIAAGVTNGFWRDARLEDMDSVNLRIDRDAEQLAAARSVAVLGGGATGVSSASNLKERYPATDVHLFFSGDQALPSYHPKVRRAVEAQLLEQGVVLHARHRAVLPPGFAGDRLTTDAVHWSTGQLPFQADATLWAVGGARPNTGFLPPDLLDADGYVKVDSQLRVPGCSNVFAVGDVAASDPDRSTARNSGHAIVAHNVRRQLAGDEQGMKRYDPPRHRWGSILGTQRNGMRVFTATGGSMRIPTFWVERVLFPWLVDRMMYKGVRK